MLKRSFIFQAGPNYIFCAWTVSTALVCIALFPDKWKDECVSFSPQITSCRVN